MPRGYRLLFIALGVVAAITVVIGAWTWPKPPALVSYGEDNPRNGSYRSGGEQCDPAQLAAIRDSRKRTRQADACAKETEEYRQNTSNLTQQTRIANASEAQAGITSQQLWTGWLQTIGGLLTLSAAVFAAKFARDAAIHTSASNDISRDAHRAWLSLRIQPKRIASAHKQGLRFEIDFFAENIGQTVASHFDFECTMIFVRQGEDVPELSARVQNKISEWVSKFSMTENSALVPTAIEKESFRRDIHSHKIKWWNVIPQSVEVCQPIFLAAVFYKTVTDPTMLQVSWRTWYVSEKAQGGGPTTFVTKNTRDLGPDEIFAEPFGTTLMHRIFPKDDRKSRT